MSSTQFNEKKHNHAYNRNNNYSVKHRSKRAEIKNETSPVQKKVSEILFLRYKCLSCNNYTNRKLHPAKFLKKCTNCKNSSHLSQLKPSFGMLYGSYTCQSKNCKYKWIEKLNFKSIITGTPYCKDCSRRKKIFSIIYKDLKVTFRNNFLFKCSYCTKVKSLTFRDKTISDPNSRKNFLIQPSCKECKTAMTFVKKSRTIFSQKIKKLVPLTPNKVSPVEGKNHRLKNYKSLRQPQFPHYIRKFNPNFESSTKGTATFKRRSRPIS